jgi:2-polyprenyl-3-methyl-5-hydroxy-6-metoxy-1,4-benzoquinol methylase
MRDVNTPERVTMPILRCNPFFSHRKSFPADDVVEKLESAATILLASWQETTTRSQNANLSSLSPRIKRLLANHAWIVGSAIGESSKPLSDMVFVEYGGGSGLQSLLARQLSIGTVVYNDIDPGQCALAEGIAGELGLKADFYVCGDIDALVQLLEAHQIKADIVTSYDVLEHIYDIDYFLGQLHTMCNRDAVMVLCSGANMFWYPYAKHSAKMQKQIETVGLEIYGEEFILPFLKGRTNIIREYSPGLTEDEVQLLGIHTRGLVSRDIVREVDRYLQTRQAPRVIEHPTNTCNPYTGSWAEHAMNPYYLAEVLASTGFDARILPMPFGETGSLVNNLLRTVLNTMIGVSGDYVGLYFSSAYAVYARYTGTPPGKKHKQRMYAHSILPVCYLVGVPYELISLFYPRRGYYSTQFKD